MLLIKSKFGTFVMQGLGVKEFNVNADVYYQFFPGKGSFLLSTSKKNTKD
jgi:hypothetical protein